MNFTESLRQIYIPETFDDTCIEDNILQHIKNQIKSNKINILIYGDHDTGKTTLLNLISKYTSSEVYMLLGLQYNTKKSLNHELETFFNFAYKSNKTLIIDDIDHLSEYNQQIVKKYIDKYYKHMNIVISCVNKNNVIDTILKRLDIINTTKYNFDKLNTWLEKVKNDTSISFTNNEYIIKNSNYSIRMILTLIEKMRYIRKQFYSLEDIKNIISNISDNIFEKYTLFCLHNDIDNASYVVNNLIENGYSIIDILESYYDFIKRTNIIEEKQILDIVQIIGMYITYFYLIHENEIEIYFFTYDLCNIFIKYNDNINMS